MGVINTHYAYEEKMSYIKSIFKVDVFPNWLGLVALIAVFISIDSQFDEDKLQLYKKSLIVGAMESNLILKNDNSEMFEPAVAELLRDNLIVRINGGYEITKHLPRLSDDIQFVTLLLSRDSKNTIMSENSCDVIKQNIVKTKTMLHKIESSRSSSNEYKKEEFEIYLTQFEYLILKKMMSWPSFDKMENQEDCFNKLIYNKALNMDAKKNAVSVS